MRERLTFAFVVLTMLLLLGAGLVRAYTTEGALRERQSEHVFEAASTAALLLEERSKRDRPVNGFVLGELVAADARLEYAAPGQPVILTNGPDYAEEDADDAITAMVPVGDATLTMRQNPLTVQTTWADNVWSLTVLFVMLAVIAGLAGYFLARALSAPFRQLAVAASALGRGRFDLELPDSRMPEARAISRALANSAVLLRDRLEREQTFSRHASHVLRTPLTALRLELEELTLDQDLPAGARDAAIHCLEAVTTLDEAAGELVEQSRSGALLAGAEIPLRDLATQSAQRWADRLADDDRKLSAAVEGDLDLPFTPGPVEHLLDLLLADVVRRGAGDVRLVFDGRPTSLRLDVSWVRGDDPEDVDDRESENAFVGAARSLVEALGGRFDVPDAGTGMRAVLPRR